MRHNRLAHLRQVDRDWVEAAKVRARVVVSFDGGVEHLGRVTFVGPHGGRVHVTLNSGRRYKLNRDRVRVVEPEAAATE